MLSGDIAHLIVTHDGRFPQTIDVPLLDVGQSDVLLPHLSPGVYTLALETQRPGKPLSTTRRWLYYRLAELPAMEISCIQAPGHQPRYKSSGKGFVVSQRDFLITVQWSAFGLADKFVVYLDGRELTATVMKSEPGVALLAVRGYQPAGNYRLWIDMIPAGLQTISQSAAIDLSFHPTDVRDESEAYIDSEELPRQQIDELPTAGQEM
jgi:hypothetical protein